MRSINKVILIGNLTRDPEKRETPNGQVVTTFGLATNREWVTKTGEKKNSAEFHECVAWARLAEICNEHLKKGRLIYVEGYLKTRTWENEEGVKKYKTEIVVQDMIMLEKRKDIDEDYVAELPSDFIEDDEIAVVSSPKVEAPKTEEPKETENKKSEFSPENRDNNPIDLDLGL